MAKPVLSVSGFRILGLRIVAYKAEESSRGSPAGLMVSLNGPGSTKPEGAGTLKEYLNLRCSSDVVVLRVSCSRQQFGESIGP